MKEAYQTDFPPRQGEVGEGLGEPEMTEPAEKPPHGFPGFWVRSAAATVDALIVSTPILSVAPSLVERLYSELGDDWLHVALALFAATNFAVLTAYEALTSAHGRRSVGKLVFGTKVVGSRLEPLSLGRSLMRASLSFTPGSLFFILFNRSRRALHDFLSGTYVVRVRPRSRMEPFLTGLLLLMIAFFTPDVAGIIRERYVKAFWSPSGSMLPAIVQGDHFFVDRFVYTKRLPERGDVVTFVSPVDNTTILVKRIIGMPGETVEIRQKAVVIDGEELDEPWGLLIGTDVVAHPPRDNFGPVVMPPDSYFLLGDNRDRSYDSRYWGTVLGPNVLGKVSFIYWSRNADQGVQWGRIGRFVR